LPEDPCSPEEKASEMTLYVPPNTNVPSSICDTAADRAVLSHVV
jgi:hypothetical protein